MARSERAAAMHRLAVAERNAKAAIRSVESTRAKLHEAMFNAVKVGNSKASVARALKTSESRVHQILRRYERNLTAADESEREAG